MWLLRGIVSCFLYTGSLMQAHLVQTSILFRKKTRKHENKKKRKIVFLLLIFLKIRRVLRKVSLLFFFVAVIASEAKQSCSLAKCISTLKSEY